MSGLPLFQEPPKPKTFRDVRLGRNQKKILEVWPRPSATEPVWLRVAHIRKLTGLDHNAVYYAMNTMTELGFFASRKEGRGGVRAPLYWNRTDKPLPPWL